MSYDFLLMRHAKSQHNRVKDQWKERYFDKSYKQMQEYKASKFCTELIDSPEIDSEQCLTAVNNTINLEEVGLVICSPLRRCLATAKSITEGKNDLKIVVEPLLCGRLAASWSICSPLALLENQFPSFDFSELRQLPQNWMLSLVTSDGKQVSEETESQESTVQEQMLDLLKKGYSETYKSFFQRTRDLKKRICKILSKHIPAESKHRKILIISHSCVLSFLLGSELNEKGKVKDKISFEHCTPRSFSYKQVVHPQPSL